MANRFLFVAAVAAVALANVASAQTQAYSPAGYSPLLFDPTDTKYVFRLNGAPWICRGDTFCKPVKIEGVADKDLPQATVESLGFAGPRYFLSYKQTNFEKGKPVVLSCLDERCGKLDTTVGEAHALGTFQVKQGDRIVTRTALLRHVEARNGRARPAPADRRRRTVSPGVVRLACAGVTGPNRWAGRAPRGARQRAGDPRPLGRSAYLRPQY